MHPFESAGLGKAPFRYIGREYRVGPIDLGNGFQAGAPGQPMGTCDYCLNGIANCYHIQSADGKRFVVGCDCVDKLYDRKTNKPLTDATYRAIDKDRKEAANKARKEREAKRIEGGFRHLDANQATLEGLKHSSPYRKEDTAWDEYQWYKLNAGNKGKLQIIKTLTQRINNAQQISTGN